MASKFPILPREIRQTILSYAIADAINNELAVCFRTYDTKGYNLQGVQLGKSGILPNDRGYLIPTWLYEPTHRAPRVHHATTILRLISLQTNEDMNFVLAQAVKKFDKDHVAIQKLTHDIFFSGKIGGDEPLIWAGKIMSRAFIRGSLDLKAPLTHNWRVACEYVDVLHFIEDDDGWICDLEQGRLEYVRRTTRFGHLL
ncbi:hypothetical protein BLS_009103 [Venturia inaequalis]|uniref:Uncharacterized protein n=1 Tax=Venturia inaequalis TaxID=5025 RepID=A0A8H3YKC3_VENIN|nr:hypothetical protein BLS_009103 [Venturia inaequalis]KAE9981154.1 hypothetical protein EG328_011830 [Venturia inaequalis]KAE9986737.1 hypothetical protein EG327_004189 [Venturia inaequalis]